MENNQINYEDYDVKSLVEQNQFLVNQIYELRRKIDFLVWESTQSMNPEDYYYPENIEDYWYPEPEDFADPVVFIPDWQAPNPNESDL